MITKNLNIQQYLNIQRYSNIQQYLNIQILVGEVNVNEIEGNKEIVLRDKDERYKILKQR